MTVNVAVVITTAALIVPRRVIVIPWPNTIRSVFVVGSCFLWVCLSVRHTGPLCVSPTILCGKGVQYRRLRR